MDDLGVKTMLSDILMLILNPKFLGPPTQSYGPPQPSYGKFL